MSLLRPSSSGLLLTPSPSTTPPAAPSSPSAPLPMPRSPEMCLGNSVLRVLMPATWARGRRGPRRKTTRTRLRRNKKITVHSTGLWRGERLFVVEIKIKCSFFFLSFSSISEEKSEHSKMGMGLCAFVSYWFKFQGLFFSSPARSERAHREVHFLVGVPAVAFGV